MNYPQIFFSSLQRQKVISQDKAMADQASKQRDH